MDALIKALETSVNVPVLMVATLGLLGAVIGMLITVFCIVMLGGKEETRKKGDEAYREEAALIIAKAKAQSGIESPGTPKPQPVKSKPVQPVQSPTLVANTVRSKQADATNQISVTSGGMDDLERRAAQRINYRIPEAATLLGIEQSQVNKLLAEGNLNAVMTSDGVKWITSSSISGLLNRIGIERPEEEAPGESGKAPAPELQPVHTDNDKLPFKQHYWYYVDNNPKGLVSLRDALKVIGFVVKDSDKVDFRKLPAEVRNRIRREPFKDNPPIEPAMGAANS